MDKGYASDDIRDETIKRGLIPVIPKKKKAKKGEQGDILKGRHVVEICFSWMNKKRGLATRYDRKQDSYDSMLFLWAAMRWWGPQSTA